MPELIAISRFTAHAAGLRYVSDKGPGIRRLRRGNGFQYVSPAGRPIREVSKLRRIRSLAVPPAWRDVWICPEPRGHIQAVGRDAKGRKQYRYHPDWAQVRGENKFSRMRLFGRALPEFRRKVQAHLDLSGLPREKVLATVARLLDTCHIRIGNEQYEKANGSFGLTTLKDRHAAVGRGKVRFRFRGKSGVLHAIEVEDPKLARIVKRCQDLPGQDLFQYVDETGEVRAIDSTMVNEYLRELMGDDFTAKDFRTWAGTVLAFDSLRALAPYGSKTEAKRNLVQAVSEVAEKLGNTKAVCRKCYIHTAVLDGYLDGKLLAAFVTCSTRTTHQPRFGLTAPERAVLRYLERVDRAAARGNAGPLRAVRRLAA